MLHCTRLADRDILRRATLQRWFWFLGCYDCEGEAVATGSGRRPVGPGQARPLNTAGFQLWGQTAGRAGPTAGGEVRRDPDDKAVRTSAFQDRGPLQGERMRPSAVDSSRSGR